MDIKKYDVLIVEDSIYAADLNIRQLRRAGFTVEYQIVEDGKGMGEALQKHWDLILSDHSLPGFSALKALELRNKIAAETPFLIVTEQITEQDMNTAWSQGCTGCVLKAELHQLRDWIFKLWSVGLQ